MKTYQYIVIGNGLMGGAAARYLSEWSDSVAIIGPGEPADHSGHNGVFASHYDQGRLVHEHSRDAIWQVIAQAAVQKYNMLETKSGVEFHGATGRVHAGRPSESEKQELIAWINSIDSTGTKMKFFDVGDRSWEEQFPMLDFPEDYSLFWEAAPAGYVNPRSMLAAQNVIAKQNGADLFAERATSVKSGADGVLVVTESGLEFSAEKVLIACGAFTNAVKLLPEPIPLRVKTESMVWGEVSAETATALKDMPGVGYDIANSPVDDTYMAPPILYPDGTYKIKMGCNTANELWPETLEEMQAWFQSGDSDLDLAPMAEAMQSQLPEVDFVKMTSHRCIVTYTPSGYPSIDAAPGDPHGRLFVATGGNGSGAQGSDTLGHAAAGLMHDGRWVDSLPRDEFKATHQWGDGTGKLSKAQERANQLD